MSRPQRAASGTWSVAAPSNGGVAYALWRIGTVVTWIVLGAVALVVLALVAPEAFGYRSLAVMSGSMEPAIHTGDLVVVRRVAPSTMHAGDVVTFSDPADRSRLITHRVRAARAGDRAVDFVTKGDANNAVERWSVRADGTVGRMAIRVPRLGYVLVWLRGPAGRVLLIVFPALVFGLMELARLWRPHGGREARRETVG